MGERGVLSTFAAQIGRAVLSQGRDEEAMGFTLESEGAASLDDVLSQVLWRGVRATALAGRGEAAEAVRVAREAVFLAAGADSPNLQGIAFLDLAEVLREGGHPDDAIEAAREALARYEAKGNVAMAGQVRERFAELEVG